MKNKINKKAFSLAEILMSLGILSIGMLFIAAVFPAGIHFTTIATERTIASSVADEAFAKIKLCGINFNSSTWPPKDDPEEFYCLDFNDVKLLPIRPSEFLYPSDPCVVDKMYSWSAICRKLEFDPTRRNIQVTVFVSRKGGAGTRYYATDLSGNLTEGSLWPVPLPVTVKAGSYPNQINIGKLPTGSPKKYFINPGCTIVDGKYGRIYRVLDRDPENPSLIYLDTEWLGDTVNDTEVWVIPPPVGGGRYPCIAVYQKVLRF